MVYQVAGGLIETTAKRSVNKLIWNQMKLFLHHENVSPNNVLFIWIWPLALDPYCEIAYLPPPPFLLIFGFFASKTTVLYNLLVNHDFRLIAFLLFCSYTWKNLISLVSDTVYMPYIKIYFKTRNRKSIDFSGNKWKYHHRTKQAEGMKLNK